MMHYIQAVVSTGWLNLIILGLFIIVMAGGTVTCTYAGYKITCIAVGRLTERKWL